MAKRKAPTKGSPIPECGECGSRVVDVEGHFNRHVKALDVMPPASIRIRKVKRWYRTVFCATCHSWRRDVLITLDGRIRLNQ